VVNSFGHPVPRVDGRLQLDATKHAASWTSRPCERRPGRVIAESAQVDLVSVYDVAGLTALSRSVEYPQDSGTAIVIADTFAAERALDFETALIVRGEVEVRDATLIIRGQGRPIEADVRASGPYAVISERIDDDPRNRFVRVALRLEERARSGCIAYRLRLSGAAVPDAWDSACSRDGLPR
jgi:hypothetical protein